MNKIKTIEEINKIITGEMTPDDGSITDYHLYHNQLKARDDRIAELEATVKRQFEELTQEKLNNLNP